MADEPREQFKDAVTESAERALDVALLPRREWLAEVGLDLQPLQGTLYALAGVVGAVVDFDALGYTPIEDGAANQTAHGLGRAGLCDVELEPTRRNVDRADDVVAAVDQLDVARRAVELPELVRADDPVVEVAKSDLVLVLPGIGVRHRRRTADEADSAKHRSDADRIPRRVDCNHRD